MLHKCLIMLLFLSVFICTDLVAQQNYQDVVYLRNGSIIRGIIIEQIIGKSLKIQTAENNVFVYSLDEVEKITKEQISEKDNYKSSNESLAFKKPSGGKKSPAIAFVLSFIVLPGSGQIYNGEPGKGISQFLLVATGYGLAIAGTNNENYGVAGGGLLLAFGCSLWSWIDAPLSASRINSERGYSQIKITKHITPTLSL